MSMRTGSRRNLRRSLSKLEAFNSYSPTGQEIDKEIECAYKASLLKKKANSVMN